jgi:hypothetical protein
LEFVNTGKFPAKVLNIRGQFGFGYDTTKLKKTYVSSLNVNENLAGDIKLPWQMKVYFEKNAAQRAKYFITTGKINVYFIGEYNYYSSTFKTYYKNKFVVEINYKEYTKTSFLVNDEYSYKRQ